MAQFCVRLGFKENGVIKYVRVAGRPDTLPGIKGQGDHTIPYALFEKCLTEACSEKRIDAAYANLLLFSIRNYLYLSSAAAIEEQQPQLSWTCDTWNKYYNYFSEIKYFSEFIRQFHSKYRDYKNKVESDFFLCHISK